MRAPTIVFLLSVAQAGLSTKPVYFVEMREHAGIEYRNTTGELEKRYIVSSLGTGAALFDYDEDGDLDLYLVNGAGLKDGSVIPVGPNRLYRNEGDWRFRDVTEMAGVGHQGFGVGAAASDFDNDGLVDLYVTNLGENVLYRNRGDGTFVDVTERAGVGHAGYGTSAAFLDADGDADLDLYVANYVNLDFRRLPAPGSRPSCQWQGLPIFCGPSGLEAASDVYYRNLGNGTFEDAGEEVGLVGNTPAYGLGVVVGDYDGDGDTDIYVANDSVPNFLFENDGNGNFREQALLAGVAYSAEGIAQAGMGVDMADLDGDGRLDLFVTNFSHDTNTIYRNFGGGLFEDATAKIMLRSDSWFYLGWATRFLDLDNDGDQDLFVANGHVYPRAGEAGSQLSYEQRNQIFWSSGSGRMEDFEFPTGDAMHAKASSRGGAFGDMDNDGDLDAVIVNIDAPPSLLKNELPGGGNALTLRLVGTVGNRDALGARVTLVAGSSRQVKEVHTSGSYLSSNDHRLHFGLGALERVDELIVRWPSGLEQKLGSVAAGAFLTIVEGR